jgi:hypothetical protein
MGISNASGYNYLKDDVVATVTIGGMRCIVESWGDAPPPRDGRPPSFEELVKEAALAPKRSAHPMPQGVHRGRPRLHRHIEKLVGE